MARFVGRENVRKRLAPLEGGQGRTIYAAGAARIELPGEAIVVRPPFGLAHEHEYDAVRLGPLFEALAEDHVVAALLVRLGGYAVGVLGGDRAAIRELLAASPQLGWLAERAITRFFAVPEPRRRQLERLPYDLYAAEVEVKYGSQP